MEKGATFCKIKALKLGYMVLVYPECLHQHRGHEKDDLDSVVYVVFPISHLLYIETKPKSCSKKNRKL